MMGIMVCCYAKSLPCLIISEELAARSIRDEISRTDYATQVRPLRLYIFVP
jgi:hypothetical protein